MRGNKNVAGQISYTFYKLACSRNHGAQLFHALRSRSVGEIAEESDDLRRRVFEVRTLVRSVIHLDQTIVNDRFYIRTYDFGSLYRAGKRARKYMGKPDSAQILRRFFGLPCRILPEGTYVTAMGAAMCARLAAGD